MLKITSPQIGAVLSVHTAHQQEFLRRDRSQLQAESFHWLDIQRQSTLDMSLANRITVSWEPQIPGTLLLSEKEVFRDVVSASGVGVCEITNLKVGTRYYIQVVAEDESSPVCWFDTEDVCPRCLWVEGLTNVRDCGGWKTTDGKRIRQGLLFRGSEMNSHMTVTPAGLKTLREELKLKSVLDVRGSSEIVENVYQGNYANIPCGGYKGLLDAPKTLQKIFTFLCEKENYPIYFHCWGGADRTATIAFILGAVLGMEYKDLIDDYEITSLSIWGNRSRNTDLFRGFWERYKQAEGATLQEKAESWLHACGITDAQIGQLRQIMLM